ncbi:MAG: NADH-quinone oxidoreductase subunit C [Holophagales bacterium]|jgi:NADH-quinone oxidoreductase subunit C|nr:NADH-quinone oxidoreductase subunit C [Holophagales bacterium]
MSHVHDPKAAPNRKINLPKTAPVPSPGAHAADVKATQAAEEAKWQKTLADYEIARANAISEGKEPPKPPVRHAVKADAHDMRWPVPVEAQDPDLHRLRELLGGAVEECFEQAGELVCQVKKEAILDALTICNQDVALRYEMLADMTATHYPGGWGFNFSIVYHLTCIRRRKRLRLRILILEGFEPESATQVYPGANWLEREIYDMLGVRFANHPDMTRILCSEEWEGHPLRKDYPAVGLGQRDIDCREDRSGVLTRKTMEAAGHLGINLKPLKAE